MLECNAYAHGHMHHGNHMRIEMILYRIDHEPKRSFVLASAFDSMVLYMYTEMLNAIK